MSNLKHYTTQDFDTEVLGSQSPVVVDFYADWCGPCKMMEPVVEQMAQDFQGKVIVGKLDTDANQDIAIRYQIRGIPTLGLYHGGKMVDRLVGYPGPLKTKEWFAKAAELSSAGRKTA